MKIPVFCIIVAISSCFVDAHPAPRLDCKLKMKQSQAENIGAQLAELLKLYVNMKNSGESCRLWCFREKIFYIMDIMAAVTDCPSQVIARLMVTHLPPSWKPHSAKIEEALWKRDVTTLSSLSVTEDAMTPTLMKAANTLLSNGGHNYTDIMTDAVLSLAGTSTAQEINRIKRSASKLGVPILIMSIKIYVIDIDARKPVANMDYLLSNLGVGKRPVGTGGGTGGQ